MIFTCTLNPAIDLYVELKELKPKIVNRTLEEDYQPNGKAVNISILLNKLGIRNKALGFIGGFSGEFIKQELIKMGIDTDFISVEGNTRINTFVNANEEYKIVNRGPIIPEVKTHEMLEKIKLLPNGSKLCISGSLPRGVSDDIFLDIAEICNTNGIKLILDISSLTLLDCLAFKPYLIKPNEEELAALFNVELSSLSKEKVIQFSKELLQRGAKQVLVSRGEQGAIYASSNHLIEVSSVKGKVINTACAGDAMLGMFIGKRELGKTIEEALQYASAAGASTAFSKGLTDLSDIEDLVKKISLKNLQVTTM
ncbi:1-phosphofructokinase [Fredinandcohnia onubensis]|uniref:1-phosphofructokinase n=1 Tax=Fredinandcohnia onubensis TaxID=1571209 RepID=UPI000C0BE72C|nr:1-phosphofructokinase [Fredinandcohnia onubensis]